MVPADEGCAVEFSFAEQRALMGAAALECTPAPASPQQHDVRPIRRQRERPRTVEFAQVNMADIMYEGTKSDAYMRDELAKKMTPEQIAEAQRLAREWKPTK